ncbi:MAG: DUF1801 domain-containing protein [Bacteroidia bacterium]
MEQSKNVDNYISSQEKETAKRLNVLRKMVRELVPENAESISYGMPAYKYKGKPLIYFAAYKNHIGLYATPQGHEAFAKELSKYKQGKGSVQFPLNEELPLDLIRRIILFRKESLEKGLK